MSDPSRSPSIWRTSYDRLSAADRARVDRFIAILAELAVERDGRINQESERTAEEDWDGVNASPTSRTR